MKKDYQSYIALRLKKYNKAGICDIPPQTLTFINDVMEIQPSYANIPDFISLINHSFKQRYDSIKVKAQQNINQPRNYRGADPFIFDRIQKSGNQYFQRIEIKGKKQLFNTKMKLSPVQIVQYLQALVNFHELKLQNLQKCLVQLIKILRDYENSSIIYDDRKHSKLQQSSFIGKSSASQSHLNKSNISESAKDKFQNDNQDFQILVQNKQMTKDGVQKVAKNTKLKKNKEKFEEIQLRQQQEIEQHNRKHQQEMRELNSKLEQFEKNNQDLQKKLDQALQKSKDTQKKLQKEHIQNSNSLTKIYKMQMQVENLQNQKRQMRFKLIEIKNQLSNTKKGKEVIQNYFELKNKTIESLKLLLGDESEQKKVAEQIQKKEDEEILKEVLNYKIVDKQEENIQLKKQIIELTEQLKKNTNSATNKEVQLQKESTHNNDKKELEAEIAKMNEFVQNEKRKVTELQNELKSRQREINELNEEMTLLKKEINRLNQQATQQNSIQIETSNLPRENYVNWQQKYNQVIRRSIQESKIIKQRFKKILQAYKIELSQREGTIEHLKKICSQLTNDNKHLQKKISDDKKELAKILDKEIKQAKEVVGYFKQQIMEKINNQKKQILVQNTQLKWKLQDLNNKYNVLEQHNKKWETTVVEHKSQLENYQKKNLQLTQEKENQKYRLNREIQNLNATLSEYQNNKSQSNYDGLNQQNTALTVSPMLEGNQKKRQLLIGFIEKLTQAVVVKSQLKYKFDQYSLNFSHYINKQAYPILILFKLAKNGHIIGAFCTSFANINSQNSGQAIIFSLQKDGRVFNKMQGGYAEGCRYADSMLTFGNSELYVKNNNAQKLLKLNTNFIGSRYFSIGSDQNLLGYANNGNEVGFEQMEIHKVYYA